MLCHWDGEEGRAVHAPGLATAPLNKESSTQRVLSQMSGPQLFKAGEVSVFCVSERGGELGGRGGKKDKKPVAGCYITKLKRRSEKPRTRTREIRGSCYDAICPLQTDRRHWPFICVNLRF